MEEISKGGKPTSLVSDSFIALIPGSLGAGRPSPPCLWGRGKEAVGGGRSDADAKVTASGHHLCAPKQNPGLEAAAALLT